MVKDGIATRAPATWKQVWPLAVFSTLLCGLTQNGARSMARVFAGRPLDHGVHAWWMTPLGDSLAIFFLALVLLLLSNWMRWAGKRTVQATVLSFPLFLTVLLLAPRLHTITEVLLAAGLAVRFGAWVPGTAFEKHLPRINAGLLFTTLLVALPMALWPMVRARLDHRALADPPAGAPNVLVLLWDTVRASSLVENLNSRLRNYFFLRRHLGPDYLALLQFFLNHRRFVRSQRPERVGKSPAQLLGSSPHPHWREMLGYVRFSRN